MILYNILIGILAILSAGLIALGILEIKTSYIEFIESPMIKGILGIVAIISICLSKYFIVELISWVALSNFSIVFVAFVIFVMYMQCINDFIEYDILNGVAVVTYPTLFLGAIYIFECFAN